MSEKAQVKHFKALNHFFISRDRDYFLENVSMLIISGMGVLEAIDAVLVDVKSKKMQRIIIEIREDVAAGSAFWKALAEVQLFPDHVLSLLRIGEESGKLADNLKIISLNQEKERLFRSKIRSAMMYPIFVLSLTLVVGLGIAWFILPRLSLIFSQLDIELPFVTKILIGAGMYLSQYGKIIIPIFLLLFILFIYFVFYFRKTRFIGQWFLFALPGIKSLIQEVEIARFGFLLGTLLEAGLPINQALNSLTAATFFPHYKKFYIYLNLKIEEGYSFKNSFLEYKGLNRLLPTPMQKLIVTGEQSGNLSKTLFKLSEIFEAKTENTTKNLTVILEPILLVIVWLGVVAVALAVVLPIYSLIGGL
jgi:type IV pilus assembly protein PilC